MRNELTLKFQMNDSKQIKKGNWEIRIWNLMKEYFKIKKMKMSWNPDFIED